MSYPQVIALLDADLNRLRIVRDLLTSEPPRKRGPKKQVIDPLRIVEEIAPGLLEMNPKVAPEPRRIAAKQRRERRVPVRRKTAEASSSALNGAVPPAPVYVSAERMKSSQLSKAEGAEAKLQEALTPEMLSRRWLQSTGR